MFNLLKKLAPSRAKKNPTKTGVAIVAMIGSECDIIELFLRHNQPFCDKFYIVLHNSFDATATIIENLQAEGFAIDVSISDQIAYEQNTITQKAIRAIADENRFEYIIPLDADEFLPYDKDISFLTTLRDKVGLDDHGFITWQNFIPTGTDYFDVENPLLDFRARSFEFLDINKVILGGEFAKKCEIVMGNHRALLDEKEPIALNIKLQHFPLRSHEQMARKYILSAYSFALASDKPIQGLAVRLQNRVREKDYALDYDFVLDYALNYANPENATAPVIDEKTVPKLDKRIKIRYRDLTQINLLRDMDRFIMHWIENSKKG